MALCCGSFVWMFMGIMPWSIVVDALTYGPPVKPGRASGAAFAVAWLVAVICAPMLQGPTRLQVSHGRAECRRSPAGDRA